MGILLSLSGIALREVVGGALHTVCLGKTGEAVASFLTEHFTDHSQRLTKALHKANEKAWKAFEVALGGESLWEQCKHALASAEDQAFRAQVRAFLDSSPLTGPSTGHATLFKQALQELRAAQARGALTAGSLAPSELAREAGVLASFSDPQAVLNAEWKLVDQVAGDLRERGPALWQLLVARPKSGTRPSLLAVAVRYYFRREVESDQVLFQGLAFAKWEALQETQEKGFAAITQALTQQGERLKGILDKLAGLIEDTNARVKGLEHKFEELLKQLQLNNREVRPSDSMSARSPGEQQKVRQLVSEYRGLPEDVRRERPKLLNEVGKLEVAAGEFADAQNDFTAAAMALHDPIAKAEAYHNAYRAALERQQWADALTALRDAVALDPGRFAPFPFARFQPQRILGAGGFGVVFLCQHIHLGKLVVVKTLSASELDRAIADVFAEARALEDVEHSVIVRLRDCDFADAAGTRPYLVMEYFEGMNLADHVAAHGTLSPDDVAAIARPVAEALQAAHGKGFLHRDVKPGNLLVRRDGANWKVKLIDFGLAFRQDKLQAKVSTEGPLAYTTTGRSIAGTLHYAAPEQMGQAPGVPVGAYSDVYGFGKTCYYALFKVPDPDDEEKEGLPEGWRRLLARCTARKIDNRLPGFAAVLAGLAQVGQKLPSPPEVKPPAPCEQDLKEALEEWRTKGDTRTYFERQAPTHIGGWQTAAQKGDFVAQWLLARCLQEGTGVQKDIQAAVSWLRRAAESGLAVAQNDLGDCLYNGAGVKADSSEAFRLYTKAAEQGLPEADANLGDCYFYGEGVEQDFAEAARCYRKAADAGWVRGHDSLGDCYFEGNGVEQDYPQAISLYRTAAEQGLASAQGTLGWCYEYGKGVKKSWTEAAKWYRKAAEQDSDGPQFGIGYCYQHGLGVEQNLAEAEEWYRKAAAQGHRKAKNALARLLAGAEVPEAEPEDIADTKGYWVIAPYAAEDPEQWQRVWDFDLAHNIISIGWTELGDISSLEEQGLRTAIDRAYPEISAQARTIYFKMLWAFFHSIKLGDVILARQGTKKLAAVGTVIRTAYHEPNKSPLAVGDGSTFANHLDVHWDDFPRDKQYPDPVFGIQTLYKIEEEKFRTLLGKPIGDRWLKVLRLLVQKGATSQDTAVQFSTFRVEAKAAGGIMYGYDNLSGEGLIEWVKREDKAGWFLHLTAAGLAALETARAVETTEGQGASPAMKQE